MRKAERGTREIFGIFRVLRLKKFIVLQKKSFYIFFLSEIDRNALYSCLGQTLSFSNNRNEGCKFCEKVLSESEIFQIS